MALRASAHLRPGRICQSSGEHESRGTQIRRASILVSCVSDVSG
jgi:hypothetical protein